MVGGLPLTVGGWHESAWTFVTPPGTSSRYLHLVPLGQGNRQRQTRNCQLPTYL